MNATEFLLALRALALEGGAEDIIEVRREWLRRIVEMAERNEPQGPYPMKHDDWFDQFGGRQR
jgi:hypothetical protein